MKEKGHEIDEVILLFIKIDTLSRLSVKVAFFLIKAEKEWSSIRGLQQVPQ
jgi:hypothetical protein